MGPRWKHSQESLGSRAWSLGTFIDTGGSAGFLPEEVESLSTVKPRKGAAEGRVSGQFAVFLEQGGATKLPGLRLSRLGPARHLPALTTGTQKEVAVGLTVGRAQGSDAKRRDTLLLPSGKAVA